MCVRAFQGLAGDRPGSVTPACGPGEGTRHYCPIVTGTLVAEVGEGHVGGGRVCAKVRGRDAGGISRLAGAAGVGVAWWTEKGVAGGRGWGL